jgi:uncharacterized protein YfiM (DUF2279 family)
MTAQSDFVQAQLSAAGIAMAGSAGVVQINTAHFSYKFSAGVAVKVLTSEWSRVLAKELYQGQPIFELATAATSASAEGGK